MAIQTGFYSGVRVTDVRISNFRSLANVDVSLEDMTVFVGANNAGKTSFLDAVYAAIGATRRVVGAEDIHVAAGEATVPLDRKAVIDVRVRPVDKDGAYSEAFPEGSFWTGLWGPGISQSDDFHEFMAFRTTLSWSAAKGDYALDRKFLKEWRPFAEWLDAEPTDKAVLAFHLEPIALHYIDAKRDLEDDFRRPGSFWRRMTDNLGLSPDQVAEFEKVLTQLNQGIVEGSEVLQHLRTSLTDMRSVVAADSASVEIAPVARRLRDLSKGFDVTFATTGACPKFCV